MKKIVLGTLLGLLVVPAFANETTLAKESYFSGEILAGSTDQEVSWKRGPASGVIKSDEGSSSFGIRGAYNLNKNIAFELGYMSHGEMSTNGTWEGNANVNLKQTLSSTAVNLGVKGVMPFKDYSVHARLGLSFWDAELEEIYTSNQSSRTLETVKGTASGNALYYGIGAEYPINEKVTLGVEYTLSSYDFEADEKEFKGVDADMDVTTLAFTLGYKF